MQFQSEHLAKYLAGLRDGVNILDKDFEHLVGVLLVCNSFPLHFMFTCHKGRKHDMYEVDFYH